MRATTSYSYEGLVAAAIEPYAADREAEIVETTLVVSRFHFLRVGSRIQ